MLAGELIPNSDIHLPLQKPRGPDQHPEIAQEGASQPSFFLHPCLHLRPEQRYWKSSWSKSGGETSRERILGQNLKIPTMSSWTPSSAKVKDARLSDQRALTGAAPANAHTAAAVPLIPILPHPRRSPEDGVSFQSTKLHRMDRLYRYLLKAEEIRCGAQSRLHRGVGRRGKTWLAIGWLLYRHNVAATSIVGIRLCVILSFIAWLHVSSLMSLRFYS